MNSGPPRNVVPLRVPPPAAEIFQPFYASQMEGRAPKPREWMVDGVIQRKTVLLLAGPPKIGKSLLLQQLLTAAATGQAWLGRQTDRTRCFGLFCEDGQEELERRQADINEYYDRTPADLETDFSWDSRDGREATLCEFERFSEKPRWTPLWNHVVGYVKDEGVQMVGLDTAAAVFAGNENFRAQTTQFLRGLQKLASDIDGCIVLSSHPSRSSPNSYSGSTSWLASVRAGISLGRPNDYDPETNQPANIRVLRGLGSNYGAGLTAERLEWDRGVFVLADAEDPVRAKRGPLTLIERQELRYRLLIGLKRVLENGGKVPADDQQPGSLAHRARRSTDSQVNRVPLQDIIVAQQEMLEAGQIVRVDVARRCLIRPADGPYYDGETEWLPALAPNSARNAVD